MWVAKNAKIVNPLEQLFVQLTLNLGAWEAGGPKTNRWRCPKMGIPAITNFDGIFMDFPV